MSATCLVAILLGLHVALSDLVARRVSNKALITVIAAAVTGMTLGVSGTPTLASALSGLCLGLLALLPFYAIGWMGAGDVKLFSVIGLLAGHGALMPVWLAASILAGIHAAVVIAWRRLQPVMPATHAGLVAMAASSPTWKSWQTELKVARQGRQGIPYAAYMGLSLIAYVLGAF